MKKNFFFMALLFMLFAMLISSCQSSGVIVAESESERNSSDGPRKMRIAGTDTTQETKTITIQITGPAEKIDRLNEAANGKFKIQYLIKKADTGAKPKTQNNKLPK